VVRAGHMVLSVTLGSPTKAKRRDDTRKLQQWAWAMVRRRVEDEDTRALMEELPNEEDVPEEPLSDDAEDEHEGEQEDGGEDAAAEQAPEVDCDSEDNMAATTDAKGGPLQPHPPTAPSTARFPFGSRATACSALPLSGRQSRGPAAHPLVGNRACSPRTPRDAVQHSYEGSPRFGGRRLPEPPQDRWSCVKKDRYFDVVQLLKRKMEQKFQRRTPETGFLKHSRNKMTHAETSRHAFDRLVYDAASKEDKSQRYPGVLIRTTDKEAERPLQTARGERRRGRSGAEWRCLRSIERNRAAQSKEAAEAVRPQTSRAGTLVSPKIVFVGDLAAAPGAADPPNGHSNAFCSRPLTRSHWRVRKSSGQNHQLQCRTADGTDGPPLKSAAPPLPPGARARHNAGGEIGAMFAHTPRATPEPEFGSEIVPELPNSNSGSPRTPPRFL